MKPADVTAAVVDTTRKQLKHLEGVVYSLGIVLGSGALPAKVRPGIEAAQDEIAMSCDALRMRLTAHDAAPDLEPQGWKCPIHGAKTVNQIGMGTCLVYVAKGIENGGMCGAGLTPLYAGEVLRT